MALLRPTVWTHQPQQACEIDLSNPITRGLVVAISGANPRLNSALNKPASFVGTPGSALTVDGRSSEFTRSSTQGISVGTSAVFNPAAMTLLSIYRPKSISGASAHMLFSRDDKSLGRAFSLDLHWNTGYGARYYVEGGGSVGTNELRQGVSAVVGKRYVVAARQTGSAAALFVDGALVSSSAAFTAKPLATGDTRIGIRTYSGSNEAADGFIPLSLMWSRALSDAEIKAISANPWQIFKPIPQRIFVPAAAGGGGVVGTASLTQADQTVSASGSVTGAAGITGTAGLTQADQTLSATGAVSLSGSATLNQSAQTVASTGAAAVSGSSTLNQAAQTLSASGSVAAAGSVTGTASINQADQTVSATGSVSIGGSASLTQDAQTISASGAIQIAGSANLAQLAQTLTASGVVLGGITGSADLVQAAQTLSASGTSSFSTIGRPTSDVSNSGWTPSSGSDLFAMLDEVTPDDLDYIGTSTLGAVCKMALNATQFPGSASQKLSLRASSSTGNGLNVVIKDGSTTIATRSLTLTPAYDLHTITLTSGEIAAITSGNLTVEMTST